VLKGKDVGSTDSKSDLSRDIASTTAADSEWSGIDGMSLLHKT